MKLDAWMPFFGDDFSSAVKMFPKNIKWIYLDCLWHYWSHTHCSGLPNDDVLLRELCACELPEWVRIKGLIFDNDKFFVLQGGKWHQLRCREEYKKAGGISESRSESGKKGAIARWQTDGKEMANEIAKPLQNDAQPQPQPQPQDTTIITATDTTIKHSDKKLGVRDEVFQKLKTKLIELYKRPTTDPWSYAEETALSEISRRPNALTEIEHIITLRKSMPFDERKRFFPQTIWKLINEDGWNGTLDKARVQCPIKSPKPIVPAAEKVKPENKKVSQDGAALKKMAEQIAAKRKEFK